VSAALQGRVADPAQRNPNPAQQNQSPAQQNQNRAATKSKPRATKSKSPSRAGDREFSKGCARFLVSPGPLPHGRGGSAPFTRGRRSPPTLEQTENTRRARLSMNCRCAPRRRPRSILREAPFGVPQDEGGDWALPPPAADSSALITASALVTVATFCIAKSIEALCHSAFIVEQQSSGTTTA
jgi:hypothetical protein